MELLRPALLWTLAGAFVALAAGLWARARARRELALWGGERHAARFVPGHSPARATVRVVLASAGLALLALALLGPVVGHTFRPVSRRGLDLVVCLDTSRSMLAQDLRPSRLERAKREIAGLLERLAGDRVALVAFSGEARDVSPLTRDRATLESLLAYVSSEDNQKGGTDLAAAIARGLDLLDGRSGAHEAIVLITDGEDLEGQGLALAEKAVERGIRIFVLGVGTVEGGKIPVVDANGKQSFLVDEEGKEVVTKLERTSLVELARRTGGEFLAADESATPLEDLYRARITRIEGREITSGERRVPYDRFQWPLAAGLACLLGATALRARRRGAAARPASARLAAALLCLPLGGEPQQAAERLTRASDELARGELEKAELTATALLQELAAAGFAEADQARAHLALGVIRAARAEGEKDDAPSLTAFEGALASFSAARALAGPGTLRLDATYDLGTTELFRGERWRARIPEVSGQPAQPGGLPGQPPAAAPGGPDDGPPPPDPLAEARKHYLEARNWLGERLRADARDADTRANLELVQRRLRELEKIEEEREQQKQENQDQENQDQKQDDQDKQDQEKKDQQDQENQDPKDPEQKDQPPKDPKDGEQDPKQQENPEEKKEGEQEPEAQEQEQAQEQKEQPGQPEGEPEERVLTREEVMQLLDRLAELEKQQKALEAQLRAKRSKAKRDW